MNSYLKFTSVTLIVFSTLLFGLKCSGIEPAPHVIWYIASCRQPHNYVEILVDTRALPENCYLEDVKVSLLCVNQINGYPKTSTINFTEPLKNDISNYYKATLNAGKIYRRYIKLPFSHAKFVRGNRILYSIKIFGASPSPLILFPEDTPEHTAANKAILAEDQKQQELQRRTDRKEIATIGTPHQIKDKHRLHSDAIITIDH